MKTDWFPALVTNQSGSADHSTACANKLTIDSSTCRATGVIDLVSPLQLQRFQDRLTVLEVVGDLWWRPVLRGTATCEATSQMACLGVLSCYKHENDQSIPNPWDTGDPGLTDPILQLFEEGDFTGSKWAWQEWSYWETEDYCTTSDPGPDASFTGVIGDIAGNTIPVGETSGTLVSGSGVIDTTSVLMSGLEVPFHGAMANGGIGSGTLGTVLKAPHHWRIRKKMGMKLSGKEACRLQLDYSNPFDSGDPLNFAVEVWGQVRVKLGLALGNVLCA